MNKIVLMGRLTRDPEVRYSNAAEPVAVANYTLAVDRRVRRDAGQNTQTADFINCRAFGKTGEFVQQYFKKGMMVCVSGRLQIDEYTDKQGQRQWFTVVLADDHSFAESRASFEQRMQTGGNNDGGYAPPPGNNYQAPPQPQMGVQQTGGQAGPPTPNDTFFEVDVDTNLSDDDLPF